MPLTDQDLSWDFTPQPVPEKFDKEAFSHHPPRPLSFGGDEGDAVQRQVDRLRDLPGTVEEIFPDGPAWGDHKLFWSYRPDPTAAESHDAPLSQHNLVTYLRHTERIMSPGWHDSSDPADVADYGLLFATYELRRMYDLSGRPVRGDNAMRGRLLLDQSFEAHILGR